MIKLNSFLRQFKPWQIAALGVGTWFLGVAVVVLVLCPLTNGLFPGAGLATSILGGIAVGWFVPRPFTEAYLDRKHDDAMFRMLEQWQRDKEAARGGSL